MLYATHTLHSRTQYMSEEDGAGGGIGAVIILHHLLQPYKDYFNDTESSCPHRNSSHR